MDLMFSALAEFFETIGSQKAHWYRVFNPGADEPNCNLIQSTFPCLSSLMKMEHDYIQQLLIEVGLAKKKMQQQHKYIVYPHRDSWDSFIKKHLLNLETTYFTINKRRHLYIKIGSWCKIKHLPKTPATIWKEALQAGSAYAIPKLRISSIAMRFAGTIGKIFFPTYLINKLHYSSSNSDEESSASSILSEEEVDEEASYSNDDDESFHDDEKESELDEVQVDVPDQKEYPIFNYHKLNINDRALHDKTVHELLKINGGEAIYYRQQSSHKGALVRIPSSDSAQQYQLKLKRKNNFMDRLISFMGESLPGKEEEAASCICSYLFDKYEKDFRLVAANNNIAIAQEKKMDASKVDAMLLETNLTTSSSRMLFRHLKQFLGKSCFESERKRRKQFSGQEFPPVTKIYEMKDKTKIHYWYKLPVELLKHYAQYIFIGENLSDVSSVDLTVGGDHGKERFRMILKLIVRFHSNKQPFSRLFQIANVDYAKDDLGVLKDTVLKPIGQSLKVISDGKLFILDYLEESMEFALNFSTPVADEASSTKKRLCNAPIRLFIVGDLKFYAQMQGRENMAGSWCMWCKMSPLEWKMDPAEVPPAHREAWTLDRLKHAKVLISEGSLTSPADIRGVVEFPVWDFLEIEYYIYPVLHGEIGLVNCAVDGFYDILDDNIEILSEEEKMARNVQIMADIAKDDAVEKRNIFK